MVILYSFIFKTYKELNTCKTSKSCLKIETKAREHQLMFQHLFKKVSFMSHPPSVTYIAVRKTVSSPTNFA